MIDIEKGVGGIMIRFPYNPAHIKKIKTIKGYKWHPNEKYWSIPYSELEKLLSVFDVEKVEIYPSIWFDELRKELTTRKYSKKTIKSYLYYNKEFLKFVKKNPYEISNND
ncbi:MAG: phage integrase N-terminal SAM-like domain-containing protein, partial [Candidatus Methanofastidiosia archaeon]